MRRIRKISVIFLSVLLCLLTFFGCADKCEDEGSNSASLDYSGVVIEECIKLGEYTGLEIELASESSAKGAAVWKAVVNNSEVLQYPTEQLEYYIEQTELRYKHHAEDCDMDYDELLETIEVTEEDIKKEAEGYVKSDLVQLAVIKAERIELTDDEKERLLDRYVQKYVADYGYDEDYVRKNLMEEVHNSMLYDKMLEYLMLKNTFTVKE